MRKISSKQDEDNYICIRRIAAELFGYFVVYSKSFFNLISLNIIDHEYGYQTSFRDVS